MNGQPLRYVESVMYPGRLALVFYISAHFWAFVVHGEDAVEPILTEDDIELSANTAENFFRNAEKRGVGGIAEALRAISLQPLFLPIATKDLRVSSGKALNPMFCNLEHMPPDDESWGEVFSSGLIRNGNDCQSFLIAKRSLAYFLEKGQSKRAFEFMEKWGSTLPPSRFDVIMSWIIVPESRSSDKERLLFENHKKQWRSLFLSKNPHYRIISLRLICKYSKDEEYNIEAAKIALKENNSIFHAYAFKLMENLHSDKAFADLAEYLKANDNDGTWIENECVMNLGYNALLKMKRHRIEATYDEKPRDRNPESEGSEFENEASPDAGIAPEERAAEVDSQSQSDE